MHRWGAVLVLCVVGCRSEEELAGERAQDAARACAEATKASKLPTVDVALDALNDDALLLRVRPGGLVLDARSALASRPGVRLQFFGRGKPPPAPQPLDPLRPVGTDDWFSYPMLERALQDYESTFTERVRGETVVALDLDPATPAPHVAAVLTALNTVRHAFVRPMLVLRHRDGTLGLLPFRGGEPMSTKACAWRSTSPDVDCVTPMVRLGSGGAQLFAWSGIADTGCWYQPHPRADAPARWNEGPFNAEGTSCEFPVKTPQDLAALGKATSEVAALGPGCRHALLNVPREATWADVAPLVAALAKHSGREVALVGLSEPFAACAPEPLRPSTWKRPAAK